MPPKRKRLGRPPGSKKKKNPKVKNECNFCGGTFKNKTYLGKHLRACAEKKALKLLDVSAKKAAFSCAECSKKFRFVESYTKHMNMDHCKLPGAVSCAQCSVRCPDQKILKQHISDVHEREIFECEHCKRQFVRRAHVLRHIAQKGCDGTLVNMFPCEACRQTGMEVAGEGLSWLANRLTEIKQNPNAIKILLRVIKAEIKIVAILYCNNKPLDNKNTTGKPPLQKICDATFTRKDNLIVHLRLQHINLNHFRCKHCDYHTGNFSKLIIHTQKLHSENPNQFECHHCSKITSSRAAMAKHLEIHGDKKYECDVCGYSTYTIEVIRRHVLTHVEEKPYKCSICGNSYIQRAQLQRHLVRHTGNVCSKCGSSFKSKAGLIIHQREHMGLGKLLCPYETCPLAKKEFSNEASLTNHVKSHLDDRPYECAVCKKRFHSDINMRRHVSTHQLDRPRRCMYCVTARAYVRGEQLVKHVRKCHPDLFRGHLQHVRQVLGTNVNIDRVKKSEMESILDVLDAESERILQGYGEGVLYGGVQDADPAADQPELPLKSESSTLMSEEALAESLKTLLTQLIDVEKLECFGWPDESVDVVLEKVIEQCGARAADRERWTRVQRLRENTKQLFLYVIEDANIARMLDTHTIDQIVQHILRQVADTGAAEV